MTGIDKQLKLSFLLLTIVVSATISSMAYGEKKIEGYDIIKEKLLPKCLEFNELDQMRVLLNEEPDLFLMCIDFLTEDGIKINSIN